MAFIKHSSSTYTVNNQNEFNQSLYDYFLEEQYLKGEIRESLQNFPEKYPCTFTIKSQMFECHRIYVEIWSKKLN